MVEEAVRDSVRSFSEKDLGLAEQIIANDEKIDQLEVEEECLKLPWMHWSTATLKKRKCVS